MLSVQNRCDMSNNTLLDVASALRSNGIQLESGLQETLYESGTILESFFEVKDMDMEVKNDGETMIVSKPVVLCKNIQNFVDYVVQKRNVKNPVTLKYGADSGGG